MNYYLHIPFCRQKCPYCKFALTPIFDEVKKRRYLAHLKSEIQAYFFGSRLESDSMEWRDLEKGADSSYRQNDKTEIDTIYFGGGTPSVLSLDEVEEILYCFGAPSPEGEGWGEVSFECNPEDITSEYVSGLFDLGINRLSIGIQSLDNDTLVSIHRSDRESIFRALDAVGSVLKDLKDEEFSTNIDFILGLPHTKIYDTLGSIKSLHKKYPYITHTSVYMLEEGLYPKEWIGQGISEQEMEEEYGKICEYFDSLGWHHYEVSSWTKPGFSCRHNQGYWDHTDYRGFGLSATSYIGGKRWMNSDSFSGYYLGKKKDEETLTEKEIHTEKMIHDLRTFRLSLDLCDREKVSEFMKNGWIKIEDEKIILTPAGIFRENFILSELIDRL